MATSSMVDKHLSYANSPYAAQSLVHAARTCCPPSSSRGLTAGSRQESLRLYWGAFVIESWSIGQMHMGCSWCFSCCRAT